MKSHLKQDFVDAERHAHFTTGEAIQMLRELKGWTQKELSKYSSIQISNKRPFIWLRKETLT